MLEPGITGRMSEEVVPENTAISAGSGALMVYATPAMIALMEKTAMISVAKELQENDTTVGTMVNIRHTSASVVGSRITAESRLTEVDGRRLVFEVKAFDDAGEIGNGIHERFIVTPDRFMEKAEKKLKKNA